MEKQVHTTEAPSGGWIGARFLERLVATPRGRAFTLRFLQSTEESDEAAVFETLLARVDDPPFRRLVKVHKGDEERHAGVFRRAVERVIERAGPDAEPGIIPNELHVVARVDTLLGGYSGRFLAGELGVLEMYAILLAVEERAVREWPAIVGALRPVDSASAQELEGVIADEMRHVKYARAIMRRYAPDEATLERTRLLVRAAEARAFAEHTVTFTRVVVERDLLAVGRLERAVWGGLARLDELRLGGLATPRPLALPAAA
jgi:rubrerythrin